jgi:hypothetical protein
MYKKDIKNLAIRPCITRIYGPIMNPAHAHLPVEIKMRAAYVFIN